MIFKVTDYIEPDLLWEEEECRKLGIAFSAYQLKNAPAADIVAAAGDADILLVNMARIDAEVLAGLTRTGVIIRHGIGYDNVDVAAATRQGIVFANEATASGEDVAEHAVMLMFQTYKKSRIQEKVLRDWISTGRWSSERIQPLHRIEGKTIGLLGCGNIGSRVLRKISGLGANVLVCDPYLKPERRAALSVVHTSLKDLLEQSDIVSLHLPVTDETRHLINNETLALMKNTAVIVNTSRGAIIKTEDLIAALREKRIAGAGLDVFEKEPPEPELALLEMDHVVATPHIAWYSEEGGWDIRRMILDDVKSVLAGRPPRYVVNKDVFGSPDLRFPLRNRS
jgi:D-3-phosphoglycerate dehydrogenase / 2-oxoglutarate reductase